MSVDPLAVAIDSAMAPYSAAGALSGVVAVSRDREPPVVRAYGRASLEPSTPVRASTRFVIGSVTKSFTAAAVLALRGRGLLELDRPVGDYLQGFPHGHRITVRHLLDHRSGLGNLFFLPNYGELARQHRTAAEVVGLVGSLPLSFEPGTRTAYNNVNYSALAWLIEARSGRPYPEAVTELVLEPLELRQTLVLDSVDQAVPELADGLDPVGMTDLAPARFNDPSIFVGSGAMASTASELIRWIAAIDAGRVASGGDRELLMDFARLRDDFRGRRAISATGWDGVGFGTHVLRLPDDSLTVAVTLNLNISGLATEIAQAVAALALGLEPEVAPIRLGRLPMDSLEALAGLYRFGPDFYVPGGVLRIVARDGGLHDVGRAPEIGLLPLADGEFLYRATWSRVRFHADDRGQGRSLTFAERFEATREGSVPPE
ncbi:MAG: serine hydrolase domain-containing protein [Gemmatimonadales bacterium]